MQTLSVRPTRPGWAQLEISHTLLFTVKIGNRFKMGKIRSNIFVPIKTSQFIDLQKSYVRKNTKFLLFFSNLPENNFCLPQTEVSFSRERVWELLFCLLFNTSIIIYIMMRFMTVFFKF